MTLNVIVLFIIWVLTVIFHQSLYVLFPILGFIYLSFSDFTIKVDQVTKPFLILFLSVLFLFSIHLFASGEVSTFNIKGLARYFGYLMGAMFVSGFNSNTIEKTLWAILTFILFQFPFEVVSLLKGVRFRGIFEHPNHYAYFLNVTLFYLLFNGAKTRLNYLAVVLVILSILGTLSSGGLLTATLLIFGRVLYKKKLALKYVLFGTVVLIILSLSFYLSSQRFQEQIDAIVHLNFESIAKSAVQKDAGGNASIIWRLIYWFSIIFEFGHESLLTKTFGLGVDSMTMGNYAYSFMVTDPHNDYLKILVELGFIGLFLFLIFQRTLYSLNHKSLSFLFLLIVPFFFGNVLVNFPFIFTLILVLSFFSISTSENTNRINRDN